LQQASGITLALVLSSVVVDGLFRLDMETTGPDGKAIPHPAKNRLVRATSCSASFVNGKPCPLLHWPKPTDEMQAPRTPLIKADVTAGYALSS
jgi:hypothetical protein